MNQRTQEKSCWPNTSIFENILQFTTVFEICRDLPLIGNLSLGKSSFPWYSSSMNSSFIKNSTTNLKAIFQRTRVSGTRVTWQTRVLQTRISKRWQIAKYFTNNGRSIHIFPNSGIQPLWPAMLGPRKTFYKKMSANAWSLNLNK